MNKVAQPSHEKAVNSFGRRISIVLIVRYALAHSVIWIFLWGIAALALRVATSPTTTQLMWGFVGVIPAVALAIFRSRRNLPSRSAIRALLDHRGEFGGLLMAAADAELGDWTNRLPDAVSPRLRLRAGRNAGLLVIGIAFLMASFVAPVRFGVLASDRPLDVDQQADQLQADIETLKREDLIEEQRAESLEQKLDAIRKDASGEDPVKTWEALDHLQDTVSAAAKESAEKLAQTTEELAKAQALSEALAEAGSGLDPKLTAESMKELSSLLESAESDRQALEKALGSQISDGLKSGSLSREQMKQLARALGERKAELAKSLGKLRDARLIDAEALKKCDKAGKCDSAGLAKFLNDNAGEMSVKSALKTWQGKGGVDRGRGDAEMTWTDASSEKGAKFKEEVLPPGGVASLKDSQLVGRSVGAPSLDNSGVARSGALSGAAAGGGSAVTQTVLPRHKGTVKRYFDRP